MLRVRLATALAVTALVTGAAPALAQDGNPFDPLPPPQATPAPTAEPPASSSSDETGRNTLYVIGGALLVSFVGIGWWISRDARRALPKERREPERLREEGPHRHERKAKEKARAKGRAQRQARKSARRR